MLAVRICASSVKPSWTSCSSRSAQSEPGSSYQPQLPLSRGCTPSKPDPLSSWRSRKCCFLCLRFLARSLMGTRVGLCDSGARACAADGIHNIVEATVEGMVQPICHSAAFPTVELSNRISLKGKAVQTVPNPKQNFFWGGLASRTKSPITPVEDIHPLIWIAVD